MPFVELNLLGAILFVMLLLVFLPPGLFLAGRFCPEVPFEVRILLSLAFSALLFGVCIWLFYAFSLPRPLAQTALWLIVCASLFVFLKERSYERFLDTSLLLALAVWLFYFLLCLSAGAFPHGHLEGVLPDALMRLTGLPIDNLIPYNVSRLFVSGIDPALVEVVPDWHLAERGPLLGMLNAAFFLLLGLEDSGPWLSPTAGLFFVFEALSVFFNSLSLFAVWVLGAVIFGRRTAYYSVLFLVPTHFLFVNTLFSWPKLFMAVIVLTAIYLWKNSGRALIPGMLFGASVLAHDSALFPAMVFTLMLFVAALRWKSPEYSRARSLAFSLRPPVLFLAGFFFVLAPWLTFKALQGEASSRLTHLHLFCNKQENADELSLTEAFAEYRKSTTLPEMLSVRLGNLIYPFNLFHPWDELRKNRRAPGRIVATLADLSFYQLIFALGPLFFVLFLASWLRLARDDGLRRLLPSVIVCYGALVPAALLFGCPLSTWNHVWAYPAFLISAVPAGRLAAVAGSWGILAVAVSFFYNLLVLLLGFFFSEPSSAYVHAGKGYFAVEAALFTAVVLLSSLGLMGRDGYERDC